MMRLLRLRRLWPSRLRSAPALAVQPDEVMKDPALEARARALSAELRCMVCQNQSIDDSDAPLARDIRILIRSSIEEGESNDAVRAYLVSRYGDFILLKPPFKLETLLLWLSPPLTLCAGLAAVLLARRRAPRAHASAQRRGGSAPRGANERRRGERLRGALHPISRDLGVISRRPSRAKPNRAKPHQMNPNKTAWLCLVLFVRIRDFSMDYGDFQIRILFSPSLP